MSRRSNIRKRERQRRRYAQRPQQVDKPIAHAVKTAGLFGAILARPISSRAFDQALKEVQAAH
jgi:hypothetical protein